jgi:hypothetical protein
LTAIQIHLADVEYFFKKLIENSKQAIEEKPIVYKLIGLRDTIEN